MTSGREIEIISIPFVAGIAAGALAVAAFPPAGLYPLVSLSMLLAIGSAAVLLRRRELLTMALLFVSTGLFCALSSHIGDGGGSEGPMQGAALWLRRLVDSIPFPHEDTSALVKALTTGDRNSLDKGLVSTFRKAGAAHILALSGMHLGIVYGMLAWLLKPLGNSTLARKIRYALIISACALYSLATGAGPSIVRAFIFIFLWETARITGRKASPMKVWCGGLVIQLAVMPSVITSAGFQLSYLAMAGIFILFPALKEWYPSEGESRLSARLNLPRRIWEAAALAISCQVFTAPLSCALFCTFRKYFLLTNLLAMPLSGLLMGLSAVTMALSAAGICPHILILADDAVCQSLINVLEIIAGI